MTRFTLTLAATTALTTVAFAADTETTQDDSALSGLQATVSDAAETVQTEAQEAYDAVSQATSDAVSSMQSATQDAMSSAEESVETMAAEAELNGADPMWRMPLDLDNRSDFIRASDIIGAEIYTINVSVDDPQWTQQERFGDVSTDWDSIGNVAELVIGPEGSVRGLVAEVGGFLGLGDTHVMIEMADLRWTQPDDDGAYAFVTRLSEEALESMQRVEKEWWE